MDSYLQIVIEAQNARAKRLTDVRKGSLLFVGHKVAGCKHRVHVIPLVFIHIVVIARANAPKTRSESF